MVSFWRSECESKKQVLRTPPSQGGFLGVLTIDVENGFFKLPLRRDCWGRHTHFEKGLQSSSWGAVSFFSLLILPKTRDSACEGGLLGPCCQGTRPDLGNKALSIRQHSQPPLSFPSPLGEGQCSMWTRWVTGAGTVKLHSRWIHIQPMQDSRFLEGIEGCQVLGLIMRDRRAWQLKQGLSHVPVWLWILASAWLALWLWDNSLPSQSFGNVTNTYRITVRITQLLRKALPTQLMPRSNKYHSTGVIYEKKIFHDPLQRGLQRPLFCHSVHSQQGWYCPQSEDIILLLLRVQSTDIHTVDKGVIRNNMACKASLGHANKGWGTLCQSYSDLLAWSESFCSSVFKITQNPSVATESRFGSRQTQLKNLPKPKQYCRSVALNPGCVWVTATVPKEANLPWFPKLWRGGSEEVAWATATVIFVVV